MDHTAGDQIWTLLRCFAASILAFLSFSFFSSFSHAAGNIIAALLQGPLHLTKASEHSSPYQPQFANTRAPLGEPKPNLCLKRWRTFLEVPLTAIPSTSSWTRREDAALSAAGEMHLEMESLAPHHRGGMLNM